MKRSGTLARKSPIARGGRIARKTSIKKRNANRRARREAAYRAFMLSPEWKAIRADAIARAGQRCEHVEPVPGAVRGALVMPVMRCPATTQLQVHHKTYARFGGRELPDDLQVLCKAHHDRVEAMKPHKWHDARRHVGGRAA